MRALIVKDKGKEAQSWSVKFGENRFRVKVGSLDYLLRTQVVYSKMLRFFKKDLAGYKYLYPAKSYGRKRFGWV